jgi:hypothetical protein
MGISGIDEEMDGAMQQAPQFGRQFMVLLISRGLHRSLAGFGENFGGRLDTYYAESVIFHLNFFPRQN